MRAQLSTYSLGYGHISILHDINTQKMPYLHRQHEDWNPREVIQSNVKSFENLSGGIKPLSFEHFMTIAVDRNIVVLDSLTHSIREADHRRVEWLPGVSHREGVAFLVDGNHRALYMEEFVLRDFFEMRKVALEMQSDLRAQTPYNPSLINGITKVINQLETTITHNSKWLVQVFDLSMCTLFL